MADFAEQLLGPPPTLELEPQGPLPQAQAASQAVGIMGPSGMTPAARTPAVTGVERPMVPSGGEAGYMQRNAQPGVPFDIFDEVGPWTALMAAFREDKADKIRYLANQFGAEKVRADDRGDPIITITDPDTGKDKDVPLNAHRMSVNDLMSLAAAVPQAVGALASVVGARRIPGVGNAKGKLGFLRDVTAGALGAESALGAEQVAQRAYDEQPIAFGEILQERAKSVPVDMAMDYATAGLAKPLLFLKEGISTGNWNVKSPLSFMRRSIQNDAIAAQQYIKRNTGVDYPLTIAESSGIPFFAKLYEYVYKHPAGAGPILTEMERKDAAKKLFQDYMIEPMTLRDDVVVGKQAVDMLQKLKDNATQEVKQQAEKVAQEARLDIGIQSGKIFGSLPKQEFDQVGDEIRTAIIAKRDAAKLKQTQLRNAIAAQPGGTGKIFDATAIGLKPQAEALLKKLPTSQTAAGPELEREFVPSKVVARLQALAQDKQYGLNDLIQMRSDVYEDIAAGQAVPNTGTHYLNQIGKALTTAIDNGINGLPTGNLKTLLQQANQQYKTEVIPFESSGIADLFRQVTEPGYVEKTDVATRILSHQDKYNRVVDFIGKGSPEHQKLKAAIWDDMMRRSAEGDTGYVDGEAFIRNLREMRDNKHTRQIYRDVFGPVGPALINSATMLGAGKSLATGKFAISDLQDILSGKRPVPASLQVLAQKVKQEQDVYKNGILKKLVKGDLDPEAIRPEDFVGKFLDAGSIEDVTKVWAHLSSNPDLQDQIRRKTIQRIFARAARSPEPADVAALLRGDNTHVVSSQGLMTAFGDPNDMKKLELILGRKRKVLLEKATSIQAAEDWARQEAGETGIFASGNAVGGLLRMKPSASGLTKEVIDFLKYKMVAVMLTKSGFQKLLSSTYTPKEIPWLAKAIVTSQPFIEAVIEDAADENTAYQVLQASKRLVGLTVEKGANQSIQNQPINAEQLLGPPPTFESISSENRAFTK